MGILEMYAFFSKKNNNKSGSIAKDRLKLVLIHDRMNNTPELLDEMRSDILDVLAKYVDIDMEGFQLEIEKSKCGKDGTVSPVISANIPIKSLKKTVNSVKKELKHELIE